MPRQTSCTMFGKKVWTTKTITMMQSATVISALTRTSSVRITSRISMCSNCLDTASCGLAHACQNLGIATIAHLPLWANYSLNRAHGGSASRRRRTASANQGQSVILLVCESTRPTARLAVKLQPVDDLVDHLAFGTHGDADQIEVGAGDCLP